CVDDQDLKASFGKIKRENNTKFASKLREITNNKGNSVDVNEIIDDIIDNCFNYLLEIGIHKLFNDYYFYLITQNFLQLNSVSGFNTLDYSSKLKLLFILHRVLEVWTFASKNILTLPDSIKRELVEKSFDFFKQNSPSDAFEYRYNSNPMSSVDQNILGTLINCSDWTKYSLTMFNKNKIPLESILIKKQVQFSLEENMDTPDLLYDIQHMTSHTLKK
ncbi:hypothetical protein ROZALSC1DRAFT_23084, partial [Rozella allomycis CSF55]